MQLLIAGFGGQGVLFLGKIIATAGMLDGKHVSWLPSYGPEMRGGTANCSVCIQDTEIGSPIISTPKTLIALNTPSYEKFIKTAHQGANIITDNSITDITTPDNFTRHSKIPATKIAIENNLPNLANIITLGHLLNIEKFTTTQTLRQAIKISLPISRQHLLDSNLQALNLGLSF